ncbi:hypothetical protein JXO59_11370 [candidate division KSB1 bacterium]|nr:hypothetical protein [candidate division KSB1 bacterium]
MMNDEKLTHTAPDTATSSGASIVKQGALRRADSDTLILSDYAAAKLAVYAREAASDEFMVLLLGRTGDTNIVRDIYLLKDQKISMASVEVSGHAINLSMWDLEDRYGDEFAILGWGHGHGRGAVFHSAIDNNNSESVFLDELAPLRIIEGEVTLRLTPDAHLPHCFTLGEHGIIKISGEGAHKDLLQKLVVEKVHPVYQGSIYSLVTNVDHEYYAERFTKTFCHHCDHIAVEHQQINVVIGRTKKHFHLDEEALRAEFREKTSPRWTSYFNWQKNDQYSSWSDYNDHWRHNSDGYNNPGIIIHQKWPEEKKNEE